MSAARDPRLAPGEPRSGCRGSSSCTVPINVRRRRGIAASRDSTTTGRRPISGSSHHQSSPRAGSTFTTSQRPRGTRPGRPTHRASRAAHGRTRSRPHRSPSCDCAPAEPSSASSTRAASFTPERVSRAAASSRSSTVVLILTRATAIFIPQTCHKTGGFRGERRRRGHNEPVCATPGSAHDDALLGTHRPCKICSWRREHSLQSQRPVWPTPAVRRQQQRRPLGSSVVRQRSESSSGRSSPGSDRRVSENYESSARAGA